MLSLEEILFEEESHVYRYKGRAYDSVTQILRLAGLADDFSAVSAERMEYAQRRGRFVHLACQYINEGALNKTSVDPALSGYISAYEHFLSDKKLKIIANEKRIVGTKLAMAGTPDLICWLDGRRSIIDYKTGVSKTTGLQTWGYKMLWEEIYPTLLIHERYGLKLNKDGTYKLTPLEDPTDGEAFMDAKAHAESVRRMGRWWKKFGIKNKEDVL